MRSPCRLLSPLGVVWLVLTLGARESSQQQEQGHDDVLRRRRLSSAPAACNVSKTYESSEWEVNWREHVDQWADSSREWESGCARLRERKDFVDAWMELWQERSKEGKEAPSSQLDAKWLPRHVIKSDCHATIIVPLEPLVGFLRHPLHHCFETSTTYHVAKEYMFPVYRSEVVPMPVGQRFPMAFYFDLGASTYRQGPGGASMSWFVEEYQKRGIDFDRILAWEAKPQQPSKLFNDFEMEPLDRLSYYNTFADPEPTAKMNPLRMLKDLARPDDFVVLKIDIDHNTVENFFIQEILQDRELSDLIDELFWENHVQRSPMYYQGWGPTPGINDVNNNSFAADASDSTKRGVVRATNDITHSYECFHALRERGIRAHSWV